MQPTNVFIILRNSEARSSVCRDRRTKIEELPIIFRTIIALLPRNVADIHADPDILVTLRTNSAALVARFRK